MSWNKSTVTDAGVDLLNESLAGHTLTITSAAGGAGLLDDDELKAATDVVDQKQTLALLGIEDYEKGKRVGIQITNKGVSESYILHQIGAKAKLEYESSETLLFILQDDRGIEIPAESENPDFLFEVYAVIAVSNIANITINSSPGAVASVDYVNNTISVELKKHSADKTAHQDIREAVRAAQEAADAASEAAKKAQEDAEAAQEVAGEMGVSTFAISIPKEAWIADEGATGRFTYYADVEHESILTSHNPDVILDNISLDIAFSCGMSPLVQTSADGKLRFYSQEPPSGTISGVCRLLASGGGSGGGSTTIPIATDTRLGVIKVPHGSGLKLDEDGNLSVDTASEKETSEAISEAFGEDPDTPTAE